MKCWLSQPVVDAPASAFQAAPQLQWQTAERVASGFCINCLSIVLVLDDKYVFPSTTTTGHAHSSPRYASAAPWYAPCCFRRSLELSFTSRGALRQVSEVDSDAEEALRAKEERGLYRHGETGALQCELALLSSSEWLCVA